MKNVTKIYSAAKKVFANLRYIVLFFLLFIIVFGILIMLPVFTIPGNSLSFQLQVYSFYNYFLLIFLALLISLMVSMNIYNFNLKMSMRSMSGGVMGGFAGFIGGIVGTATCPYCLVAILGLIGLSGSVFFLLKYQLYVSLISILFISLSIYFVSLSIERNCDKCVERRYLENEKTN